MAIYRNQFSSICMALKWSTASIFFAYIILFEWCPKTQKYFTHFKVDGTEIRFPFQTFCSWKFAFLFIIDQIYQFSSVPKETEFFILTSQLFCHDIFFFLSFYHFSLSSSLFFLPSENDVDGKKYKFVSRVFHLISSKKKKKKKGKKRKKKLPFSNFGVCLLFECFLLGNINTRKLFFDSCLVMLSQLRNRQRKKNVLKAIILLRSFKTI